MTTMVWLLNKTHALWLATLLLAALVGCNNATAPPHSQVVHATVSWQRKAVDEPVILEIADRETLDKLLSCLIGFDSSDDTVDKLDKSELNAWADEATIEFVRLDETKTRVYVGSNYWNVVGVQRDLPLRPEFYELLGPLGPH